MSSSRYKIPNVQQPQALNNPSAPYSSGVYYGRVVAVDNDNYPNEGLIKVNIPFFDSKSKVFCRENEPKSLRTNNKKLTRKQGVVQGGNSVDPAEQPITNQKRIDDLEKRVDAGGNEPKIDNKSCIAVPYCFPLLPKNLQILPKLGEMCLVLVEDIKNPQQNRYWIGSLFSQKSKLSYEKSQSGADLLNKNVVPGISRKLNQNLEKRGDFTGGFPEKFDISLMGRNNADIVLPTNKEKGDRINSKGEVLIRAGKFKFNPFGELELNTKNPGFLRIKTANQLGDFENTSTHSMLYSDYISLVSYKNSDGSSGVPFIRQINPLIETDRELFNFHDSLSPLVRGDRLVTFLELLVNYVKNHNHPYPKLPATNANSKPEIEKFNLKSILSPHIRIN